MTNVMNMRKGTSNLFIHPHEENNHLPIKIPISQSQDLLPPQLINKRIFPLKTNAKNLSVITNPDMPTKSARDLHKTLEKSFKNNKVKSHRYHHTPKKERMRIAEESFKSGLTPSEYSRRNNISLSNLYAWRKSFQQTQEAAKEASQPSQGDIQFANLVVEQPKAPASAPLDTIGHIEITFGAVSVKLATDTSAEKIAEIVKLLGAAS